MDTDKRENSELRTQKMIYFIQVLDFTSWTKMDMISIQSHFQKHGYFAIFLPRMSNKQNVTQSI